MNQPDPAASQPDKCSVWGEREMAAFDRAVIDNSYNAVVACDEHGNLVVFNPTAREWHGVDARAISSDEWASYYGLYLQDGVTPLPEDEIPLIRAFRGETIRDVPIVIRAEGQPPRQVACGGSPFFDETGRKIGAFVVMVDTTAVHNLTHELKHLASHDVLTGLPNRRTFESVVDRATQFAARGLVSTVLFVDVDRFKTCNDRFGHEFGDTVLVAIAQRMKGAIREIDTVARIGGDEFGIVLWGQSGAAVELVSKRLSDAVTAEGLSYDLDIGLSIGSALITSDSDASTVLAEADSQMYRVKARASQGLAEGDDVLTQGERPLAELARDIVERRLAEKRLAESQLRLQAVVESAPFGAHMYELTDDDRLVFVGYNRKAQEMLGVDHDELIGLTLEEAFPGNAGTETPAQYRRVAREQVTWETEELAYDAGGISGVFEVLAFPFGPERMAVFFRDITEKRRLEIALEQGDVRYRRLIRNMREGFAYCRLLFDDFGEPVDWLFLDANDKIDRSMSGHHVTGKRALEVWPEVRSLAPELFDACCRVGISREPEELDFRVGPETWVHYSVTSPEQNHFVVVGSDVSARKCAEEGLARTARALRALSGVNEVLVHAETEDDLLAAVCEVVVRDAGYALTWVGYAEQDEGRSVRPRMHYGEGSDYLESVTVSWGEGPLGQGPTGRSIRECEPVVMHDMQTDPSYEPWKGPAIARGFESSVSLPLVDQNGVTFGALVIYSRDRDAFDGEEMNLLSEMAEDLSYGISTIRARERHEETGRELIRTNERLEGVLKSITETMGKVIEMRDPYTQGHELGVATISRQIAMEIGLSEDEVDGIEVAALVHDIGKLAVPVEILTKPGKLTDIEFEIIKVHSQCGYDVLKDIDFDWPVAEAVLQHHERMDGSGYPSGLRGEEILMAARVLMVADVLEAMAADRPYRPALGLDAAMAEITGHPEKFEPRVVEACVRLFEEGRLELGGHP